MTADTLPWQYDAACAQQFGDLWFDLAHQADAKRICKTVCPVRQLCEDHILKVEGCSSYKDRYGIAAGLTPKARWRLSKAKAAA